MVKDLIVREDNQFHPGGIDFDGSSIWLPVSEYRPKSKATIYKVNPRTMEAKAAFSVPDHIGAVIHNIDSNTIVGMNWGNETFFTWSLGGKAINRTEKWPYQYINYQDCKYAGRNQMLCSGSSYFPKTLAGDISFGGLELIDLKKMIPVFQAPVVQFVPSKM